MKKILFGVAAAVAVAMLAGCPGGLNLSGNKYDATMTMDSTVISDSTKIAGNAKSYSDKTWGDITDEKEKKEFYQRQWKRLGSLEKAEALTTTITVDLSSSILVNPGDANRKAVWGFAFDFDTNGPGSDKVDFCLVGIRQKSQASGSTPANYEYYFERYIDILEKYNERNGVGLLTNAGSLGPYLTVGTSGTVLGTILYEADTSASYTNWTGNIQSGGANDWVELKTGMYDASTTQFVTNLYVTQETKGKYEVYLGTNDSTKQKIAEFGVSGDAKNITKQNTTVAGLSRYGPVSKNGYLMGGIACYASCPYTTKLKVHYETPKDKIQGAIFAAPVEE